MRLLADPRRTLPLMITGVVGALVIWGIYQPNAISDSLLQVAQIVVAGAVVLGIGQLLLVHLRHLRTATGRRMESVVLVVALVIGFGVQLSADLLGGDFAWAAGALLRYIYQPLAASLVALLTFFALRAAWRAVRVRPREGTVVVVVAAVWLLLSGPWVAMIPGLQAVLDWIRVYPVVGVTRGLLLGIGVGATVATVRLLLGFDQPYLDR